MHNSGLSRIKTKGEAVNSNDFLWWCSMKIRMFSFWKQNMDFLLT